jgi:hypothetical protein
MTMAGANLYKPDNGKDAGLAGSAVGLGLTEIGLFVLHFGQ